MEIKGLRFVLTCSACPEQYDVYDDQENLVGYVRLRWGGLSCSYPCVGGEQIYYADIGDCRAGCFESDEQRHKYLHEIADRIVEKMHELDTKE